MTGVAQDQVPDRVFVTKAEHDPVPLAGHEGELVTAIPVVGTWANWINEGLGGGTMLGGPFGIDPTTDTFGGKVFASDPGSSTLGFLPSTDAHSEYWDTPNGVSTKSLAGMGRIIAGGQP